ncbi:Predicted metal-dependent hydrolase, TIM-barrel fold [Paenibacillus sp. 1_12]|uniref:amidohydrolase family protein n=1 Tax=Paenibacillus sp. 1_12 TaxID=1566278 RepID=UPI0008E1D5FC|nr:amidohydrolase family protein [Paenibacillus sp. 1_12]SFL56114.1 Predicted metal-dependent hydrolase, TIM-barrel fold [Paenibacillus sp. 1_12]
MQKKEHLKATSLPIIDCDVHVNPKDANVIKAYLEEPWKHRFQLRVDTFFRSPLQLDGNLFPESGGPVGSDPVLIRKQLLEPHGIKHAILMPKARVSANHDPDYATAVANAYNRWLADEWLDQGNEDGAFKGSITVAHQDPSAAAAEIDRCAKHAHFVQVLMDTGSRHLFGQRSYWPIYEACARNNLPLALHPGADGEGINTLASPGFPSYYLEYYVGLSFAMQVHLVSMITEGIFERFPTLKIILTEGGAAWLPALIWRLDAEYKGLRSEVPWLSKKPSEYLVDHVRFTTQPLEGEANDPRLLDMLSMLQFDRMLMFSSDYPYSGFESIEQTIPQLPYEQRERILSYNAKELYQL